MAGRICVAIAALLFAALFGFFYILNSRGVSPEELARRCAGARPAWQSYQEDLKGQIGAAPVAAWRGHPVEARFTDTEILVLFALEGKWVDYAAALPVLLRTPSGDVLTGVAEDKAGARRTYRFAMEEDSGRAAWIQLRYPHASKRILPDAGGVWRRPQPAPAPPA